MELVSITLRSDGAISPRADRTLRARTGRYFRIAQLSIPHETAAKLLLTSLSVAGRSQFLSAGCVPALLFSDQAVVEDFDLDPTTETDDEICVSLTNTTDLPAEVEVTLRGYVEGEVLAGAKRRFMGLGSTLIAGGQRCNVHVQPARIFQAERLVVPSTVADHFRLVDVKVGKSSQLVSSGSLPAAMFTEKVPQSVERGLAIDFCYPSVFLTITVDNVSGEARYFTGALVGRG